jgi:hypothetical protein
MSERERERLGHDALGIVLFALSVFAAASIVMATRRPVEDAGGTTALIAGLVAAIGAWPGLVLAAGLAWLGGRLWLGGVAVFALRPLAGLAGVSLGLSVLLGALTDAGGGALGASTGGAVSRQLSAPIGVLFGLACLGLPLWFAWLRGPVLARNRARAQEVDSPEAAPAESQQVRAQPAPKGESAVSEGASGRSLGATGLPDPSRDYEARLQPLYPPDVRRHGGIPEGARPLPPVHEPESKQGGPPAPAVPERGAEAPPGAGQPPGAHLAPGPTPSEPPVEPDSPAGEFRAGGALEGPMPGSEATGRESAATVAAEAPPVGEAQAFPLAEGEEDAVSAPPAPTWEEPGLFEEEPVDAYGTPLSLVERLRLANEATRQGLSDESPAPEPSAISREGAEVPKEPRADPGAGAPSPAASDAAGSPVPAAPDADGAPAPAAPDADGEAAPEGEGSEVPPDPAPAPRRQRRKARGKPAEAELFAPDAPEPDVVLVPRATPLATAGAADEDDLVFRAGCLILERKRVAVSMLQREFGLDFTQATALLDRLQASGLIGPYLGGQHRDILLTPQEWQERVGAG